MIALAMRTARNYSVEDADWLDDPVGFDFAVVVANKIFEALRPPGPAVEGEVAKADRMMAGITAARMLHQVQNADTSQPINEGTRSERMAALVKAELGEVAMRPQIFAGTAKQLRAEAERLEAEEKSVKKGTTNGTR